jgi:hypothetical protein
MRLTCVYAGTLYTSKKKKMKTILLIIGLIFSLNIDGQNQIVGEYQDNFGGKLKLKADSTFEYKWFFDLASSWTNGEWRTNDDTIILKSILIFDTILIQKTNTKNWENNNVVLSFDENSDIITEEQHAVSFLTSGMQNKIEAPNKLFFRNDKLIIISKNGKLNRKRRKGTLTNKKYRTWFKKKK